MRHTESLSNTQLEILKAFRHDLSEADLKQFKKVIALFFANIAMDEADRVWEEEKWDDTKVASILSTKMRKEN